MFYSQDGTKFYGAAVSFYERYTERLSDEQMDRLELSSNEGGAVEDNSSNNDPADQVSFSCPLWHPCYLLYDCSWISMRILQYA